MIEFGNLNDWHSDIARERDGVPFDLERGSSTLPLGQRRMLIVRRAGTRNRLFLAQSAIMRKHAEKLAGSADDASDDDAIERQSAMAHAIAHSIVIGWRNICDANGDAVPFTPDACEQMLRYCPDIAEQVLNFAVERANFQAAEAAKEIDEVKTQPGGVHAQALSSTT